MPILILIVIILILMLLAPAVAIWAVNELLEQAGVSNQISWNFWSWLAMWLLLGALHGGRATYKSK